MDWTYGHWTALFSAQVITAERRDQFALSVCNPLCLAVWLSEISSNAPCRGRFAGLKFLADIVQRHAAGACVPLTTPTPAVRRLAKL